MVLKPGVEFAEVGILVSLFTLLILCKVHIRAEPRYITLLNLQRQLLEWQGAKIGPRCGAGASKCRIVMEMGGFVMMRIFYDHS